MRFPTVAVMAFAMTGCTTTPMGDSLLGADFDEVRARFGAPLSCIAGGGILQFAYPCAHGVIADAVVVADGVVMRVSPDIRPQPPVDGPQALVGAHVEQAVERLGALRSVTRSTATSELEFDAAVVTVYDGWIVGVREKA